VTYSEATVADTITTHFVPVQINTQEEAGHSIVERFHQAWTPDLRILSPQGAELYRWNGYLPPFEFLPQLLVARAYACLALQDPAGAAEEYRQALERFPTSAVAPEAQYFLAVSLYKSHHAASDLLDNWHQLQTRYPESLWRLKQSFVEKAPDSHPAGGGER
jgi:TolA-binding protein